jgi:glutamyl-tRNA reductase
MLLASCQRLEVYGFDIGDCDAPLQLRGIDALHHLAEVAAGLHSVVLGEAEILGQVRTALADAPAELRQPGEVAVAAARELRRATEFNSHSGHMLDRALSHAGQQPGGVALVAGAGAVGRLVALRARDLGFGRVIVAARRRPDAEWFTAGGFEFVPLSEMASLPAVDAVVGCLGSSADELDPARDLPSVSGLIVDLGTPRNFASTPGIPAITIADLLRDSRPHSRARRETLRGQLHALVNRRLAMAGDTRATPVGMLRASVEAARAEEAARIRRLHPEIPAETVDTITRALVNRILHGPSERLRRMDDESLARELARLFEADEETPG